MQSIFAVSRKNTKKGVSPQYRGDTLLYVNININIILLDKYFLTIDDVKAGSGNLLKLAT